MFQLALQMLFGDRGKYIALVLGITFAALIMTQQPSIFLGLMTRTYAYIENLRLPDIWVMDPGIEFVEENKPMRDTDLQLVRGAPGVAWAVPLHKSLITARLPDGNRRLIDLSGLDDATLVGAPAVMIEGRIDDLRRADAIIVDAEAARNRLAFIDPITNKKRGVRVGDVLEVNDKRALVVGISKAVRTFTVQPLVYTTYSRAIAWVPPQRRMLSYILVKAQGNPDDVAKSITQRTGLKAMTADDFKWANLNYWMKNTGIPINFGISVMLGFLVGAAIAGQTFFSFVRENLKQFAALKAMGMSHARLAGMVMVQALTVGLIGYGFGVGLTAAFGLRMKDSVLAFYFPWQLMLFSLAGVLLIITVSALIAMRTIFKVDAAEVFRT
ncbi:MAG: FtsX-like permease family protein [Alphaproteobacteria bacterium]|nr:FtsX-like permease family protein [Alphaproteobacteria bacterium]NDC56084.1 FtsX-like permease family protein [Alphaproteobacteria bacterium]